MGIETFLLWGAVGLAGTWLARRAAGDGVGLVGDLFVGLLGAFLGGLLFRALGVHRGLWGLPSTLFVAFFGAVVLLLLSRLLRRPPA